MARVRKTAQVERIAATPVHVPYVCPELAAWNERWAVPFDVEPLIVSCRVLGAISGLGS